MIDAQHHDSPGDAGPKDGPGALVILGMHRSGTSVVTSALASAGLAIGDRLVEAAPGNDEGHFEDRDFVELHARILRANGLGSEGYATSASIHIPPELEAEAHTIVANRRQAGKPWGWKDPRATLFLDFWLSLLPEARFLMLFRRPWAVVDSLYRRGDEPFQLNPAFAIDVWMAYNRRIRDFFLSNRNRCLLLESEAAVGDCRGLVIAVRERFGLPLGEPAVVARPERFQLGEGSRRRDLLGALRPEAIRLHDEMRSLAGGRQERATPPCDTATALELAMGEWARAARAEGANAAMRDQLAASRSEQARLADELASANEALEHLRLVEQAQHVRQAAVPAMADRPASCSQPIRQRIVRESLRLYRRAREWAVNDTTAADREDVGHGLLATVLPFRGRSKPFIDAGPQLPAAGDR